jgi:hypothetical protein
LPWQVLRLPLPQPASAASPIKHVIETRHLIGVTSKLYIPRRTKGNSISTSLSQRRGGQLAIASAETPQPRRSPATPLRIPVENSPSRIRIACKWRGIYQQRS